MLNIYDTLVVDQGSALASRTRFLSFGFDFFFRRVVNKNFVWSSWCMELASLAPVIAGRVGKQIPLCIESGTRNWTLDGIESLETLFVVLIPKVYHPVCSHRGECSELSMEGNSIDTKYIRFLSMTFKGETVFAGHLLQVMDSHTALNATHRKTSTIGETGNTPTLVFERRFLTSVFARLSRYIVRNDVPAGRGDDHEIPVHV